MSNFWVIDTKCKVLPQSVLPQDGSDYYFGRSVVPAESREVAVEKLTGFLKEQDILVESVLAEVLYEDGNWSDDDDFEVQLSYEEASNTNEIELGCFISEKSSKKELIMSNGAMTLAEGSQHKDYKTDATLVLNGIGDRGHVLRTAYDSLSVWKTKYAKNVSPFYPRLKTTVKEAALIDDEIWVFGIDGNRSKDIVDAITIATAYHKVPAKYFLSSIYIKNLNAENERGMDLKILVSLNKDLYKKAVIAIKEACAHFGVKESVNIYVYSSNVNYKIPKDDLHQALKAGGAGNVETDSRELNFRSGSNDNLVRGRIDTNMHVARLDF